MPELLHPGVYVREIPSGVRPIEGVSTSTAAFIGVADKGPIPGTTLPTGRMAVPPMVTSFTDYNRQFGGFRRDAFLAYAVQAFFNNGGARAYIIRIAKGAARAGAGPVTFTAAASGDWPTNHLRLEVADAGDRDPTHFKLIVKAFNQGGNLVPVETLDNLAVRDPNAASDPPRYAPTLLADPTNGSKLVRIDVSQARLTQRPGNTSMIQLTGGKNDGATPAHVTLPVVGGAPGVDVAAKDPGAWANNNLFVEVTGPSGGAAGNFDLNVYLLNTKVESYPDVTFDSSPAGATPPQNYARTLVNGTANNPGSAYITIPNDFIVAPAVTAAAVALTGGANGGGSDTATASLVLGLSAANEGLWGNHIAVVIGESSDGAADNFKLTVYEDGVPVETYDSMSYLGSATLDPTTPTGASTPAQYGRTVVNSRSAYIAITADFSTRPPDSPGSPPNQTPLALAGGSDFAAGSTLGDADYIGLAAATNKTTGTGLHALDKITDVNLVAIPGQGGASLVASCVGYCKNRPLQDCFFIGDMGTVNTVDAARSDTVAMQGVATIADAKGFSTGFTNKAAGDFGAVYYPWVWASDPVGKGSNPRILLPPSGFVAGLYARIDNSRGVFKAPAGTEAGLNGVLATPVDVSDSEQDTLNPVSVNVIRTVPGGGIVVWGTRTIGSNAEWRYIPVRRMAIFLRVSIYNGIQYAVFEPNDEPLWASLRMNIRAFMLTQFRAGAFQGGKPDDAFFVKCDSSTTTQQDIDNGVVNILVGFAPLKPAEFVVLRLQQKVNQPAA